MRFAQRWKGLAKKEGEKKVEETRMINTFHAIYGKHSSLSLARLVDTVTRHCCWFSFIVITPRFLLKLNLQGGAHLLDDPVSQRGVTSLLRFHPQEPPPQWQIDGCHGADGCNHRQPNGRGAL